MLWVVILSHMLSCKFFSLPLQCTAMSVMHSLCIKPPTIPHQLESRCYTENTLKLENKTQSPDAEQRCSIWKVHVTHPHYSAHSHTTNSVPHVMATGHAETNKLMDEAIISLFCFTQGLSPGPNWYESRWQGKRHIPLSFPSPPPSILYDFPSS